MPWEVKILDKGPIIETHYIGYVPADALKEAALSTMQKGLEQGTGLFLGDCTKLEGGHTVFDLFFLADDIGSSILGNIEKEALLLPSLPALREHITFWEMKCRNQGLRVRIFEDREHAIHWLLEKDN